MWIIAYDIACPRRWRRLHHLVREHGVRVQWSVFMVTETPFRKARFLSAAAKLIDPAADDIRLYRVTDSSILDPKGRPLPILPAGVNWHGLRAASARVA